MSHSSPDGIELSKYSSLQSLELSINKEKVLSIKQKEMKATEIKAKELVEKYYKSLFDVRLSDTHIMKSAIQCAIIGVQNNIDFNNYYIKKSFSDEINYIVIAINNTNKFWQEVLTHLKEM